MAIGQTPTPSMGNSMRRHRVLISIVVAFFLLLGLFGGLVYRSYAAIRNGNLVTAYQKAAASSFTKSGTSTNGNNPVSRVLVETQSSPSIGPKDAPLTIVEFGDFECPFCKASLLTVKQILQEFPNKVRFIYRDFPVPSLHATAVQAANAARCANAQGKFWQYHDLLYLNAERHTDADLLLYGEQVGLDMGVLRSCVTTMKNVADIQQDVAVGTQFGVEGTPTWFFNGYRIEGALSLGNFRKIVQLGIAGKIPAAQ